MKQLLPLAAIAAAMFTISACQQDPISTSTPTSRPSTTSSVAAPALTYTSSTSTTAHHVTTTTWHVSVMDSDGGHATNIYSAPSGYADKDATWSGDGGKISFIEYNGTTMAIKLVPVSLVNGVPTGGTATTVVSITSDTTAILYQAHSSTTTNPRIAYSRVAGHSWGNLYTVSTSGGTPTLLYQTGTLSGHQREVQSVTWSPDDSHLAFHVRTAIAGNAGTERDTIFIMDMSTSTISDTIAIQNGAGVLGLEWSRSGANVIAWGQADTAQVHNIKYYNATTHTLTTGASGFSLPTWSPNNGTIIGRSTSSTSVYYKTSYGSTSSSATGISTTNVFQLPQYALNWKR